MDVASAVAELLDRQAITDLIHAYCYHFDRNEPAEVAALFAAGATVDYGPEAATIVGADAIAATIAVGLEQTFAATSHHVSNIQITLEEVDRARAVTYLYAWHRLRRRLPRRRAVGALPPSLRAHGRRLADRRARAHGSRHRKLPPRDDAPDRPLLDLPLLPPCARAARIPPCSACRRARSAARSSPRRPRTMLDALRHDEQLALLQHHVAVAQLDGQPPLEHEEEVVRPPRGCARRTRPAPSRPPACSRSGSRRCRGSTPLRAARASPPG